MLSRIQKAMKEKDEGFTLIELLVVIIIIGILAAIAIPVFLNQRTKATEASIKSDLKTIGTAMETYYVDNQSYPSLTGAASPLTIGTQTVTLSKNNLAATTTDGAFTSPGSFCIAVYNSDLGMGSVQYYSSAQGGILPKGTACTP